MKPLAWTLFCLPLALSIGALGLREAARAAPVHHASHPHAREFVPPSMWLAATAAGGAALKLTVDPAQSRALATSAIGVRRFATQGWLSLAADERTLELELDLYALQPSALDRVHIQARGVDGHATAAFGVHAVNVRTSWSTDERTSECVALVTWLRLPGGAVRLHGVLPLESDLSEPSTWRERSAPATLAFDLTLSPEQVER